VKVGRRILVGKSEGRLVLGPALWVPDLERKERQWSFADINDVIMRCKSDRVEVNDNQRSRKTVRCAGRVRRIIPDSLLQT
jgi:hypothetical protein